MQVLRPDGTVGTTRTSAVQLADKSTAALGLLADQLAAQMAAAAAALDFEEAAHLRDEVAAVRAELDRRVGGGAGGS
jgi:excinuclease UvrABC nuclease subunit